jgi:arylsulfatase A-like enzyme
MRFRFALFSFLGLLLVWIVFYLFFVFPSPFYHGKTGAIADKKGQEEVSLDIINTISDFNAAPYADQKWIRPNPYNGGLLVSLGKYLWLVETRRAVPAEKIIEVEFIPDSTSVLRFGTGVNDKTADFTIMINGVAVFKEQLNPAAERNSFLFRNFLKYFSFEFFNQLGYWSDYTVPLVKWSGQSVKIEFCGKHGFWSNPIISKQAAVKKPNVILIQIDALRADLVKQKRFKTLNDIMVESSYFANAYANGNWTRSSNYIQFFAKLNSEMGLNTHDFYISNKEKQFFYWQQFQSLPAILRQQGYICSAIADNIFLHGFSEWGVDIGFDEVKDFEKLKYGSMYIADESISWINRHRDLPFFLFIDFNQLHAPYNPSILKLNIIEWFKSMRFGQYLGCVHYQDEILGKLWSCLKESNLLDDTIVIVNADHGENFYHFGRKKYNGFGDKIKVKEHGYTIWLDEIRVPLIFYWKNKVIARENQEYVSLMDIPKTVLSLLKLECPKDWGGTDLSPLLLAAEKRSDWQQQPLIIEGKRELSLIDKGFQYITPLENNIAEELYRIENDPFNQHNLVKTNSAKAAAMRNFLKKKYHPGYLVLVVNYWLDDGQSASLGFSDNSLVKFFGGMPEVGLNKEFTLSGKGNMHIVFSELPDYIDVHNADLRFSGLKIRNKQSRYILDKKGIALLMDGYGTSMEKANGVFVYLTAVTTFFNDQQMNPKEIPVDSMKQILVDWGYLKK